MGEVLQGIRETLDPRHRSTLGSTNNMAHLLKDMGELEPWRRQGR